MVAHLKPLESDIRQNCTEGWASSNGDFPGPKVFRQTLEVRTFDNGEMRSREASWQRAESRLSLKFQSAGPQALNCAPAKDGPPGYVFRGKSAGQRRVVRHGRWNPYWTDRACRASPFPGFPELEHTLSPSPSGPRSDQIHAGARRGNSQAAARWGDAPRGQFLLASREREGIALGLLREVRLDYPSQPDEHGQ